MPALIRVQSKAAVYVAATRQHVGKTSTCLGILQGLTSRLDRIGFLKPVGQESVAVQGGSLRVDKDVAVAKGKTELFTVVEGTGHTGVGSIVGCNNARIAAELGVDMVLVANGGLGSAFDDLALNYAMCKAHGVKIRGVILNKVLPSRVEMLREYFPKAMRHWGGTVSLLGVVPNSPTLSNPSMLDFEGLFATTMLNARTRRHQQYDKTTLVTAGVQRFVTKLSSSEYTRALFVTHVSRNDIITGFLSYAQEFERVQKKPYTGGLILTGSPSDDHPQDHIVEMITNASAPVLYAPIPTFEAMVKPTVNAVACASAAKFNPTDEAKVRACGEHYASHIDFDAILAR
ncbi:hypothetical protein PsorP6_017713 [Peronosclerospora sorghi]|uniref:Uncharacterized protein n=1 Tax=Peronosclerospora sorghi TaxID=230839 RepID=A0ACC0WMR9_9STRA|nr:hypothetical protein PsorP6_017713 [Peronosclerospora sorghi]